VGGEHGIRYIQDAEQEGMANGARRGWRQEGRMRRKSRKEQDPAARRGGRKQSREKRRKRGKTGLHAQRSSPLLLMRWGRVRRRTERERRGLEGLYRLGLGLARVLCLAWVQCLPVLHLHVVDVDHLDVCVGVGGSDFFMASKNG